MPSEANTSRDATYPTVTETQLQPTHSWLAASVSAATASLQACGGGGEESADNTTITLNGPQLVGVPVALALYVNQLFEIAKPQGEAIEAATTIDAVDAVVWPCELGATSIGHRDYCLA